MLDFRVSKKICQFDRGKIESQMLDDRGMLSTLDGWRISFDTHPHDTIVSISGPGFDDAFYLFEAPLCLAEARMRWWKPWTWIGRPKAVNDGKDTRARAHAVLMYALEKAKI